jgi:hypothetical protein
VLISEIVDVTLIGEEVLSTLSHALKELVREGGVIIPQAGKILAVPVESEALHRQDRVGVVSGFDVGAFNDFSRFTHFTAQLAQFAYRPLADAAEVFRFDFARPDAVPEARMVEMTATESGTWHAVASWFELALDGERRLSNDPRIAGSHWMQFIHLCDRPRRFERGETLKLAASHNRQFIFYRLDVDS